MGTFKTYDSLNRLTGILSTNRSLPDAAQYTYKAAGLRIRLSQADGSYWIYQYDSLGQVMGSKFPAPSQWINYSLVKALIQGDLSSLWIAHPTLPGLVE